MFCEMKTCIHIYNNVFGAIFDTYMKPSAKTPDQPEVTSLEAVDRTNRRIFSDNLGYPNPTPNLFAIFDEISWCQIATFHQFVASNE